MPKFRLSLVLLTATILMLSCKKESALQQLPAATHVGANTFGCLINGNPFVCTGAGGKFSQSGPGVLFEAYADSFAIIFATTDNPHYNFSITSNFPFILGTYSMGDTPYGLGGEFDDFSNGTIPSGGNTFVTDSLHHGLITYTYFDKNIIAGTFEFDAVNGGDSVIHITNGRFDIANH